VSNKYHAKKTWSELAQRWFASKAEAKRANELCLLEKAGEISELSYQTKFVLSVKPKITYTADFKYKEHGTPDYYVYEDVKGVLTRDTRTKIAWVKEKYGIEVKLVRGY